MHTNHVNILLPDYVRGKLRRDEIDSVEEHLRTCPSCRSDLEEIREAVDALQHRGTHKVPQSYFSSVLPRVHERLDRPGRFDWIGNPLLNRIVLPFSAAVVAVVVVVLSPFGNRGGYNESPLQAVVDSASTEDITEIVQQDIPSHDWSSLNDMVLTRAMDNEQFVRRELLKEALASDITSPFNVFSDVSPQQFLGDLDETQTDDILQRLGHMGSL